MSSVNINNYSMYNKFLGTLINEFGSDGVARFIKITDLFDEFPTPDMARIFFEGWYYDVDMDVMKFMYMNADFVTKDHMMDFMEYSIIPLGHEDNKLSKLLRDVLNSKNAKRFGGIPTDDLLEDYLTNDLNDGHGPIKTTKVLVNFMMMPHPDRIIRIKQIMESLGDKLPTNIHDFLASYVAGKKEEMTASSASVSGP